MSVNTANIVLPLELLNVGESGRVVEISAPNDWGHRLQELGVREGATVRMVRSGEPSIIAVDGHRFSFRCDPSTSILVEVAESTS